MGSVKAECPKCHKVYPIPEERIPRGQEISFPCPACKGVIKVVACAASRAQSTPPQQDSGDDLKGTDLKARILKRVKDLPPMPQTVFKAREVLGNPQSSFQEVASVLEADQAIAARILKMANSSYYGMVGKVSSIQHASVVLGYKTLAEVVTLAGASGLLGNKLEGYDQDAGELWKHSLGVALGSKIISRLKRPELTDDAFAAGLIHDAGKLILDPYVLERKKSFREFMEAEPRPFLLAEKEILGFDHGEIAYDLCKTWNVPQNLIAAIRYHHSPARSRQNELPYIVHVADSVAMMSGVGAGLDGMLYEMDDTAMAFLGLGQDDLAAIMVEMVESVEKISSEMKTA
ncbi:MAG: HDOD domain-containing protein [Thermodesulfobacteriota bacterium]